MNINEYMEKYKETEGALLVDLRNPEDYQRAHIPGAINIQMDQLRDEIRRIATFRTPVFFYCYAGIRSAQAEALLTAKGYQAYNIGSFEEYTGEREGKTVRMQMKELRKEKGLSQVQMAESIGVQPVTISAIETARMKISAKIADRVRAVYDVEVVDTDLSTQPAREEARTRKTQKRCARQKTGAEEGKCDCHLSGRVRPADYRGRNSGQGRQSGPNLCLPG